MKTLTRRYNSLFFDGNQLSRVVLVQGNRFRLIDTTNLYFKEVPRYGGQDYETELGDIKRGNKTLFKDELYSKLPINRVVPKDSIPYDVRLNLLASDYDSNDGDWLFLAWNFDAEKVESRPRYDTETSTAIEHHYTSEDYGDLIFKCSEWFSTEKQMKVRLFEKLNSSCSELFIEGEKNTRSKIVAELALYDFVMSEGDSIYVESEKVTDSHGMTKYVAKVNSPKLELLERRMNTEQELNHFKETYDYQTIFKNDCRKPETYKIWRVTE